MSTPWEKNGRGRRIIGILTDLTSSAKHGSISFVLLLINFSVWHAEAQPSGGPEHQSEYSYARFSPSMAVIIVVLIAALFIMGFFSIYIRHCSDARTGRSILPVAGGSIGGRSRRNAARGLDPSVIEKLPIFEYSAVKSHKIGKGALECAVCLNEFEDDDTLRLLPKCDHVFHPDCIDAWLSSHTTCPVCRSNLTVFTGEEADDSGNHDEQVSDQDADSDEMTRRLNAGTSENSAPIRVEVEENSELEGCADNVQTLPRSTNQNRSMRSLSIKSFLIPIFPRSHSTGHSLVQPGENLERFTLRLPEDVRKQMINRRLNRAVSLVVLPSERSGRRGYRGGAGEDSTGGRNYRRLERPERSEKSDRWVFSITPPFFSRTGSLKSPRTGSVRSPRVAANASDGPSKNLDAV